MGTKKKWSPPNAWAPIHVMAEDVFNPKYKKYTVLKFKAERTVQAIRAYSNMLQKQPGSNNLSPNGVMNTLRHMFYRFNKALSKKPGYDIKYNELDCIDYRKYTGEQDPTIKEELDAITDNNIEFLRSIYPIFYEGVIFGISHEEIIYFKVLEFDENYIKVHIKQLGIFDEESLRSKSLDHYYKNNELKLLIPEVEADFVFDIVEANKDIGLAENGLAPSYTNARSGYDILSSVSPKELNVNKIEYDIWRKLNLKICKEGEIFASPTARAAYNFPENEVDNYQLLGMVYIRYMMLTNYYLNREKQLRRESKKKVSVNAGVSNDTEYEGGKISDKNIKVIGNIKIHYSDESKERIERRRYTFRKQAWERKGYYRKMKSGKIVKVKPCVCRRKGLDPNNTVMSATQKIIKVV